MTQFELGCILYGVFSLLILVRCKLSLILKQIFIFLTDLRLKLKSSSSGFHSSYKLCMLLIFLTFFFFFRPALKVHGKNTSKFTKKPVSVPPCYSDSQHQEREGWGGGGGREREGERVTVAAVVQMKCFRI